MLKEYESKLSQQAKHRYVSSLPVVHISMSDSSKQLAKDLISEVKKKKEYYYQH